MLKFTAMGAAAFGFVLSTLAVPAFAATDDAWDAFRVDVEAKCLAAAEPLFETAEATVDPFGSPSYGLALIRGQARGADVTIMAICVYDKQTKVAEIGGELPDLAAASSAPTLAPVAWADALTPCNEECTAALDTLTPADAMTLEGLRQTVDDTIAAVTADATLPWDPDARSALQAVQALPTAGNFDALTAGVHDCTVYWYGFLDNGGQTVGHHQCRIDRSGDTLTVSKTTGEMMTATIVPAGGANIAVGRTFLAGQPERTYDPANPDNAGNANFGNFVGLALTDGSSLYIVDADLRGFTEPDPLYFAVLVVN